MPFLSEELRTELRQRMVSTVKEDDLRPVWVWLEPPHLPRVADTDVAGSAAFWFHVLCEKFSKNIRNCFAR